MCVRPQRNARGLQLITQFTLFDANWSENKSITARTRCKTDLQNGPAQRCAFGLGFRCDDDVNFHFQWLRFHLSSKFPRTAISMRQACGRVVFPLKPLLNFNRRLVEWHNKTWSKNINRQRLAATREERSSIDVQELFTLEKIDARCCWSMYTELCTLFTLCESIKASKTVELKRKKRNLNETMFAGWSVAWLNDGFLFECRDYLPQINRIPKLPTNKHKPTRCSLSVSLFLIKF